MSISQHHTRGGHIERQAHNGGKQQHSGKGGEFKRAERVQADHQNDQTNDNVQRKKDVEQEGADGHHHEQDQGKQGDGQDKRFCQPDGP